MASGAFKPGEAEALVLQMRSHLRAGEMGPADALLETLLKRLGPRFDWYQRANFGGRSRETQEDAVREMIYQMCRGLRDLTDRAGAKCFETHFNLATERCLYTAVRNVWREEHDKTVSLDSSTGDESGDTLAEQLPDEDALKAMESVINQASLAQFLGRLPLPRHAVVLASRLSGDKWDVVAAKAGVSEKTARNDYESLKPLIHRFLTGS